jgi:hypothetical protein
MIEPFTCTLSFRTETEGSGEIRCSDEKADRNKEFKYAPEANAPGALLCMLFGLPSRRSRIQRIYSASAEVSRPSNCARNG